MKQSKGAKVLKEVAKNNGISIAEVRREIEIAIDAAMSSPDPDAQAFWKQYIQTGTKPTPEEFIIFMAERVKTKRSIHRPQWKS